MAFVRPLYVISLVFMLFSKALVVFGTITDGDYLLFLDWRNSEELLETHKKRIYEQLTIAIVTLRVGRHMMQRSFVSFLLFSVVVIRCLAIQARLLRMARSLCTLHGPLVVTACVALSATLFYLKLVIEVSYAAYFLMVVCKNPSVKDMASLALGVLRLLEWR